MAVNTVYSQSSCICSVQLNVSQAGSLFEELLQSLALSFKTVTQYYQ